jgi:hypothetical protein
VVFNLTRFARDKYDHFALRSHLQSLGISLRSATEPIDDAFRRSCPGECQARRRGNERIPISRCAASFVCESCGRGLAGS